MKPKPYKKIFFLLIFFGLFFSLGNISLAGTVCTGANSGCSAGYTCEKISENDDGSTNYECVKSASNTTTTNTNKPSKITFTPQIPFGDIKEGMKIDGGTIGTYIKEIYKYGVGVVGILSMIVIMWGGVRWLTAGGNQEAVKDAQEWIKGALSGLILVMTSYMILYFVNPDLTTFKLINITPIEGGSKSAAAVKAGAAGSAKMDTDMKGNTCDKYSDQLYENAIQFNTQKKATLAPGCNKYEAAFAKAAADTGVDIKLLKAISMAESGCDPDLINTNDNESTDCGIMQINETAEYNCDWLKNNPVQSIKIAATYLASHPQEETKHLVAGYNTGYGEVSVSNKKAALASSSDCPGRYAYECCIDPGGLSTTQKYVNNVMMYINGQ